LAPLPGFPFTAGFLQRGLGNAASVAAAIAAAYQAEKEKEEREDKLAARWAAVQGQHAQRAELFAANAFVIQ
jgi:hypothetical protein